jgi:hypothetical protein
VTRGVWVHEGLGIAKGIEDGAESLDLFSDPRLLL